MKRPTRGEAEALRDRFGDEVRAEILVKAETTRRQHPRIASMLDVIAHRLFEPGLTVRKVKAVLRIRDNSIAILFHRVVGLPPALYIGHCRACVAERLLLETDLGIRRIGDVLGYSSIQVFSRAFTKLTGVRPSRFREGQRVPLDDPDFARRALGGELTPTEARRWLRHLIETYVERRGVDVPGSDAIRRPPDGPISA